MTHGATVSTLALQGYSILNGESHPGTGDSFHGIDPATGEKLDPVYHCASIEDLNVAADFAEAAFATLASSPVKSGAVSAHIAAGIESILPEIVERAHRETALPEGA